MHDPDHFDVRIHQPIENQPVAHGPSQQTRDQIVALEPNSSVLSQLLDLRFEPRDKLQSSQWLVARDEIGKFIEVADCGGRETS